MGVLQEVKQGFHEVPLWGWGALGAGALVFFIFRSRQQSAAQAGVTSSSPLNVPMVPANAGDISSIPSIVNYLAGSDSQYQANFLALQTALQNEMDLIAGLQAGALGSGGGTGGGTGTGTTPPPSDTGGGTNPPPNYLGPPTPAPAVYPGANDVPTYPDVPPETGSYVPPYDPITSAPILMGSYVPPSIPSLPALYAPPPPPPPPPITTSYMGVPTAPPAFYPIDASAISTPAMYGATDTTSPFYGTNVPTLAGGLSAFAPPPVYNPFSGAASGLADFANTPVASAGATAPLLMGSYVPPPAPTIQIAGVTSIGGHVASGV